MRSLRLQWLVIGLIAVALAVLIIPRLSGGGGTADRCQSVPRSTLDAIEEGMLGGTSLTGGGAMQAGEWWYVAAEIDGPSMEESGDVGVWAVPDPADPGPIIAVDGFARNFSEWGTAGEIETLERTMGVSRSDALEAQDCA